MNAMYDVLSSMVISGVVLLMIVTFNGTIVEHAGAQTVTVMAQSNMTTLADMMQYEMKKMGYLVSLGADSAIAYADSTTITFKGAMSYDGAVDIITYKFEPTISPNPNKKTHVLRKTVNGTTQLINLGITSFRITYFDSIGTQFISYPVALPHRIKSIKLAVNVESLSPYIPTDQQQYLKASPGTYWERTIKPPNIN
jgi:hypothetical protein